MVTLVGKNTVTLVTGITEVRSDWVAIIGESGRLIFVYRATVVPNPSNADCAIL